MECSDITEIDKSRLIVLTDKLWIRVGDSCNILRECTRRMRTTEAMIKKLDPNFESLIGKQWFELTVSEALAQRANQ